MVPAFLALAHAALRSRLAEVPEETDLGALVRTRRELEVSEESWRGAIVNDVGDRSAFESANKKARDDLDRWTDEHGPETDRSEEHTSELQSVMRIPYAVFYMNKKPPETINIKVTRFAQTIFEYFCS